VKSVMDQETSRNRQPQGSQAGAPCLTRCRLEQDFSVDRANDRRQDVRIRILRDVSCDLGDSSFVEDPLSLKFGLNLAVVESKETRKEPERAHHEVEVMPRLLPTDPKKMELETSHG
jgi:hypothetical protein